MSLKAFKKWRKERKDSVGFKVEHNKNGFAIELECFMRRKNIKRVDLAERAGFTPAYVTKVLRGDANFTIESMTKLASAVDAELCLHLAPVGMTSHWFDSYVNTESAYAVRSEEQRKNIDVAIHSWLAHGTSQEDESARH